MPYMPLTPTRQPQLLRFGLRQMFVAVTLLCGLMALLVLTRGPVALAIAGLTALIGAHVFATFVGTRLQEISQEATQSQKDETKDAPL